MEQPRSDPARNARLEIAEAFHLAFLVALLGTAKADTWAVKGGANLRFWYDSLRFSEDIDIDVHVAAEQMRPRIEKAFDSAALAKLLASVGSTIEHLNPKDRTVTKEKWKIGLRNAAAGSDLVYTQVEVSYREYGLEAYLAIEAPKSPAALAHPPILPPLVAHYVPRGALIQKVGALADRRHTQPRDVFDIDHLTRKFPGAAAKDLIDASIIDVAIARVFELTFEQYRAKVVSFLDPEIRAAFDGPTVWTDMQLRVVDLLERMR